MGFLYVAYSVHYKIHCPKGLTQFSYLSRPFNIQQGKNKSNLSWQFLKLTLELPWKSLNGVTLQLDLVRNKPKAVTKSSV
jgi:hypothetical protein